MRYKRLRLSSQAFAKLLGEGYHPDYKVIRDPWPQDARIVSLQPGLLYGVELVIESESFPIVQEGELIPLLDPVISSDLAHVKAHSRTADRD